MNSWQGHDDAYKWLKFPERNPESWTIGNPEFLRKHPGYEEGYYQALDEIAHDPDFLRGREEGRNGRGEDNTGDEFYDMGVKVGRQELREEWERALDALDDALQNMQGTSPYKELADNLEAGGKPRPKDGRDYQPHHIVPLRGRLADLQPVRDRLEKFGIKINQAENGWRAPGTANQSLNNLKYEREISEAILKAETR